MLSPWSHERAYWQRQPGPPSLIPLAKAAPGATGQAAERTQLLSSSLTALATPFQNDRIAEKAFAHFVNWQVEQGTQGLVVCSATGEGATLTPRERGLVIQIAVETAAGRVPIVAATDVNCMRESVALAQAAQVAGATVALIVAPYYSKPSQEELYRHYCETARSVDLPLIVENDPSRTGVDILPETLARLAEIPNIVGVENVTGDLGRRANGALSMRRDFLHLSGDDDSCVLFRMAGGEGSVSVVANAVPKLWAETQQASAFGNWGRAMAIRVRLQPLLSALRLETNPGPIKYALTFLRPWFSSETRLPLVPVSYDTGNAIVAALQDLGLIEGSLTGSDPTPYT